MQRYTLFHKYKKKSHTRGKISGTEICKSGLNSGYRLPFLAERGVVLGGGAEAGQRAGILLNITQSQVPENQYQQGTPSYSPLTPLFIIPLLTLGLVRVR